MLRLSLVLLVSLLSACASESIVPNPAINPPTVKPLAKPSCDCTQTSQPAPAEPLKPIEPVKSIESKPDVAKQADYSLLRPAKWEDIESFTSDDFVQAWPAWLQSCTALKNKPAWQVVCDEAIKLNNPKKWAIIAFFKQYFSVYATTNQDATNTGLITGYYEPQHNGSRIKTEVYKYPLYAKPDDLITVDLSSVYPELANKRVRGRLVGNKLVPYYQRGEIESDSTPLRGKELLWLEDIVDVFFLQIQGSGLIKLENGEQVHVGYADQNGQAYNSIGKVLIDRGELTADKASMQGIKTWAVNNPSKLREILNANPSYVFFRELPAGLPGPLGALGVPILAERVVAVDARYIPLGAPVFLETSYPNTAKPLNRLMMAQDTGGAIKGGVRADFFWGAGELAGKQAGAMKQTGKIWVLLPKEFVLPSNSSN